MDAKVVGTVLPVLEISLRSGESIVAESGELSWMSDAIQLRTTTQGGGGGGIFGAFKRSVGGGTFFMTEYSASAPGYVAFATKVPGQILPVQLQADHGYMIHRHGFLCGTPEVTLSVGFQRSLGAGIFGGEGFILQRLGGSGDAWIELDGEVVIYDLQPGETLRVHPGHVGMFDDRVSFNLTTVPGIKNKIFSGDGLFLAALTGPGRVWLQSLPLSRLAHALIPFLPTVSDDSSNASAGAAGGIAGAVMKGIFRND